MLLVIVAMSIFLFGAVGLAIDGAHLYAERQMAQGAADAAAQAGIRSLFVGTNSSDVYDSSSNPGGHGFSTAGAFTCSPSDPRTPCYYAQTLNGFAGDTVTVDFPTAGAVGVPSSRLSTSDPVNLLRVTISRQVPTSFFSFIGSWTPTVQASATAAIVNVRAAAPIVITHPTMAGALSMNGNTGITITGGPQQSIQINSSGTNPPGAAYSGPSSGSVDLSIAGPNGTGGDFGTFGGPATNPGNVNLGSTGTYVAPSYPILDPLASVAAPAVPPNALTPAPCTTNCGSCPGGASTCMEYTPGLYTGGISTTGPAMFDPGIYYINGGGFTTKNSTVGMCTSCADDPTTKSGMLIYDTGTLSGGCNASGGFTIDTNSNDVFLGAGVSSANLTAPPSAPYYGILFFEDRNACAQTHTLGKGNGCFSVVGTIYLTNTLDIMTNSPSQYQAVLYHGTPCSSTQNYGEIIASQLTVRGTSGINMGVSSTSLSLRQLALVQ